MVESIAIGNTLAELVSERLSSDRRDWWRSTLSAARGGELGATADAFAPAAQKVGTATLHRDVSDRALVMAQTAAGGLIASWALDEVPKARFVGAPLARVVGLASRTTTELVRMATAYASERAAAGRTIPEDIALIAAAEGSLR